MDTTQLESFRLIAETGSLTQAAEQLHISQPAMSVTLKRFEEDLGAQLFERTANRIYLNEAGEAALVHVNRILEDFRRMQADVQAVSCQSLSLSIGFCDPGVRWFCVPRFSVVHPEITVKARLYQPEEGEALLRERSCDLLVSPRKIEGPGIRNLPFLADRVYLSVPTESSLAGKKTISLREIPSQALLIPQIGGYFLTQIDRIVREENPRITLVKNEFDITQHLVRTTNFLATVSTLSIELRNDGPHRTLIPLDDPELQVTYQIAYLSGNRRKVEGFLEWAEACRDQTETAP